MTHPDIAECWPDVSFTPTEARLLAYLVERGGEPVPEGELLREVWGYAPTAKTRTVPTTIRRLRRKIETDPGRPRQLLFLRGQGYCVVPPEAPSLTRAEVERRLREWLGPGQDWVTLVAPAPGERGHVPSETGPMFGRLDVLDALTERVRDGERLLTVHGAAGLGKTTLALALARGLRDRFAGGAWFCAVEEALDADDLLDAIIGCIGVTATPDEGRTRADLLVRALRHLGPTLLVLDNFEQLPDEAAGAVADLLARAPQLQVVVTSRRVLGLPAEATHSLEPLCLDEGVALLEHCLERAGLPTAEDGELLRAIVALVEGVPLAIEMAAARARLLSLSELHARLERDLGLLAHAAGGRPDRQKTLDQAIAWSWKLLGEAERQALAALGVFRGGFTVEAGERVLDAQDGLDRLASLVDHSMIRRMPGGRLALFESVRQFVERQLPVPDATRSRHACWALEQLQALGGPGMDTRNTAEVDNLLAAHDFLLQTADPRAIDLLDGLLSMRTARGVPRGLVERGRRTRAAVARTADQGVRLHAMLAAALLHERSFEDAAVEIDRGLERVRPGSEEHVRLLSSSSYLAHQRGQVEEGLAQAQEAARHAEALGLLHRQCHARMLCGATLLHLGRPEAAERAFAEAAAQAAAIGSRSQEAQAQANRASALLNQGRTAEGLERMEAALERAREAGSPSVLYSIRVGLAVSYLVAQRYAEAHALYRDVLSQDPLHGATRVAGLLYVNAGLSALYVDEPGEAVTLLGRAREEIRRSGRGGPSRVMADVYYAVALAESGEGGDALAIWAELAPPEPDALWPRAPGEYALCEAQAHLVRWREDGDAAHLHAARAVLEERGPECPHSAACVVLDRALARAR